MIRRTILLCVCVAALAAAPTAQAPAALTPVPTLSDGQKLEWQKLLTRLAEEKGKAAQAEADYLKALRGLETVQKDAVTLLATFAVPGFTLDPTTLTYTPAPPKTPEGKAPPKS